MCHPVSQVRLMSYSHKQQGPASFSSSLINPNFVTRKWAMSQVRISYLHPFLRKFRSNSLLHPNFPPESGQHDRLSHLMCVYVSVCVRGQMC